MSFHVYVDQRLVAISDDVVDALSMATREISTLAHELGCAVVDTERDAVMIVSGWVQLPAGVTRC